MMELKSLGQKWKGLPGAPEIRRWLARKLIAVAYTVNQDEIQEQVALSVLGTYLSYWPDDLCFEEILDVLGNPEHERSEEVAVWAPLENQDVEGLMQDILNSVSVRLYAIEQGVL
jgi:hypothetical protein